jgi:hypothetical protein
MINCGGLVHILDFFDVPEQALVYVVDSHRPANLHNVFGDQV